MTLTEEKSIRVEVTEEGYLISKEYTTILKDGVFFSKSNPHTKCLVPMQVVKEPIAGTDPIEYNVSYVDTDLTNEDIKVQTIAAAVWTQEVKDAYLLRLNK